MTLTMLDLCSGLGGASQAMRDRGWRVVTVDNLEWLKPSVAADIRALPFAAFPIDLLWASVPCQEYSRTLLPWIKNAPTPDLTLYHAAHAAITQLAPRWWVMENVRAAARWWGNPAFRFGSRYLWTNLALLPRLEPLPFKQSVSGSGPLAYWKRSKIPYPLSEAIAATVESLCAVAPR